MRHSPATPRRAGFTLVELLVAAGLSVLVMAILATAFQQGMETLSHLKSTVTLSQQLRGVEAVIRNDLGAAHLEDGTTGNTVRVSDRDRIGGGWLSPNKGYFRLELPTAPTDEGADSDARSYRADNHAMAFTVRLAGDAPETVLTADATGLSQLLQQSRRSMVSQAEANAVFAGVWGEVGYFLDQPPGLTTTFEDGSAGVPLYTLRRWVRALAPDPQSQQTGVNAATFYNVSVDSLATGNVNTPATVATSDRFANSSPAGPRAMFPGSAVFNRTDSNAGQLLAVKNNFQGSDVLLSNVISMQVLPMLDDAQGRVRDYAADPGNPSLFPGSSYPWAFDTATPSLAGTAPNQYRTSLKGVQIKLRVYDVRNRMTRQMTIAQDL